MRFTHFVVAMLLAFFTSVYAGESSDQTAQLPIKHFAHLPMLKSPAVSPNGQFIAVLVNNEQNYNVAVTPFAQQQLTNIVSIKEGEARIESVHWINNERLLIDTSYVETIAGKNIKLGRLYAVNKDGSDLIEIRSRASRDDRYERFRNKSNVISYLKDDPEHILIQGYSDREVDPVVFKVNVYDNDFEKLFVNSYKVSQWYANEHGDVVLGLAYDEENPNLRKFWYRQPDSEQWQVIGEYNAGADAVFNPVAFDSSKQLAYILTDYQTGRMSLYSFDIDKGEYVEKIYSNPTYDVDSVIVEDDQVVGVKYYDDYLQQVYFDASSEKLNQLIQNSFKQFEATVASKSRDNKKVVVYGVRDNMPGSYYLVDLTTGKANFWFSTYPYLVGKPLSVKQSFSIPVDKNINVSGYLSRPLNSSADTPLIVLPHGGPVARDYKYFDPLVQLLTNQGYAVLQPNFRGSEGFGSAFEVAGYKQWGLKMQDDVMAAVDWAIAQGGIDKSRMCVVGMSYGGYVALTAAFKTPERFNCFVSVAGVSSLPDFVGRDRAFDVLSAMRDMMIGDLDNSQDLKAMKENSIINHIAQVTKPILLIHGDIDTRVSPQQSRRLYDALDNADKSVNYIELDFGSHFLDSQPNRIKAFTAIAEFLNENL